MYLAFKSVQTFFHCFIQEPVRCVLYGGHCKQALIFSLKCPMIKVKAPTREREQRENCDTQSIFLQGREEKKHIWYLWYWYFPLENAMCRQQYKCNGASKFIFPKIIKRKPTLVVFLNSLHGCNSEDRCPLGSFLGIY